MSADSAGEKDYDFSVTGCFTIPKNYEPIYSTDGMIVGFKLPDGRQVQLIIGLEVTKWETSGSVTSDNEYITSEAAMDDAGFRDLYYGDCHFIP